MLLREIFEKRKKKTQNGIHGQAGSSVVQTYVLSGGQHARGSKGQSPLKQKKRPFSEAFDFFQWLLCSSSMLQTWQKYMQAQWTKTHHARCGTWPMASSDSYRRHPCCYIFLTVNQLSLKDQLLPGMAWLWTSLSISCCIICLLGIVGYIHDTPPSFLSSLTALSCEGETWERKKKKQERG